MSEIEKDLIEVLIKHDVIDEDSLRDYRIRKRYKFLRDIERKKGKEAREILANEFNLSEKTIEYIIYLKKG